MNYIRSALRHTTVTKKRRLEDSRLLIYLHKTIHQQLVIEEIAWRFGTLRKSLVQLISRSSSINFSARKNIMVRSRDLLKQQQQQQKEKEQAAEELANAKKVDPHLSSPVQIARQSLLNWLKLFRAECQSLNILLRGGLRDNALHNTIFHKESMVCCRLLGLWYRNYKKQIVFHFLQQVELFRKKKRQKKSLKRLMAKRSSNNNNKNKTTEDNHGDRKDNNSKKTNKKKKKTKKLSSCSRSSVRGKKSFENDGFGGAAFISTRSELHLRKKILLRLVRAGWSCGAELQLLRANTSAVTMGLIAGLARMHKLMSSSSSDEEVNRDEDGLFAKWLLV